MNRVSLALAAAAATFAFAQHARAADMPGPGPAPLLRGPSAIVTSSWAGIYLGGHAGYAWTDGEYIINDGVIERIGIDASGFLGGGQIGAQAQWGHWVIGVEGAYTWADLDQTRPASLVPTRTAAVDVRQIGTIAGKLGWAWDRWMVYGKGGIAFGRVHTLDTTIAPPITFDSRVWETGYTLGIGVDYMLTPSWIVGAELNYYNFTFNRSLTSSTGAVPAAIHDSNVDVFAMMVRANYLFNTRW
jgi:outer membrane immunogenic protein